MTLMHGDCLEKLKSIESCSVDSLVTDPPAGISFMGKSWDSDKGGRNQWIEWMAEVMRECHRVLKPGAHGLVWALPRTSHWTATALEDAGFEIRDVVTHLFGSGFPKSHDISKAIDKAAGAERDRIPGGQGGNNNILNARKSGEAILWQGWGTALKPANEHWILIRKPCSEDTVAKNVVRWGTGGINIDAGRIGTEERKNQQKDTAAWKGNSWGANPQPSKNEFKSVSGRFPANLVLSHSEYCTDEMCDIECAIKMLDAQSGIREGGHYPKKGNAGIFGEADKYQGNDFRDKPGGASRFFYCAKISSSERNAGCENLPDVKTAMSGGAQGALARGESEYITETASGYDRIKTVKNSHPTVKPKKLMGYLIKLITPPSGVVLDPFMGSGSTGIAAKENGFEFIGIEREQEYFEIAKKRLNA